MNDLVAIEPTETGFSPDRPGCVATGATQHEVEQEMRDAMEFHVEGLKLDGYAVPVPSTRLAYIAA